MCSSLGRHASFQRQKIVALHLYVPHVEDVILSFQIHKGDRQPLTSCSTLPADEHGKAKNCLAIFDK